jgi:hypothetical protein
LPGTLGLVVEVDEQRLVKPRLDGAVHVPVVAGRELLAAQKAVDVLDQRLALEVRAGAGLSPGLGDELGYVLTDPHTLQSKAAENVFALGDHLRDAA